MHHPQSFSRLPHSGRKCLLGLLIAALSLTPCVYGPTTSMQVSAATQLSSRWVMSKQLLPRQKSVATMSAKISPQVTSLLSSPRKGDAQSRQVATAALKGATYGILNAEFDSPAAQARFAPKGATVFNRYDRFADLFIPIGPQAEKIVQAIGYAEGLKYLEPDGVVTVPPPPRGTVPKLRGKQTAEQIVQGGLDGLTGKGVIIAIVDSGVDFRNPDFITYDAAGQPTSRLLYLWDTTSDAFEAKKLGSKPPLTYPNGTSVGTLYTQQQLTAELRAAKPQIPATDLVGHGTACAGIAAGNGNNGKGIDYVKGVAPEADIIAIRAGGGELANGEAADGISNAWLLNALCGWLDSVAGAQPLVVSCSFGGHFGGHDGQRLSERQLDVRFAPEKKSRALVIAAGNEGAFPMHAEAQFKKQKEPGLITWEAEQPVMITLYFDTAEAKEIRIAPALKPAQSSGMPKTVVRAEGVNPITEKYEVQIVSTERDGGIFLYNASGSAMKTDAYILGGMFVEGMSPAHLIGTPGVVKHAITVGSYDWNDQFNFKGQLVQVPSFCDKQNPQPMVIGGLSCYSSPGYSRNGTIKPDIVAPGEIFHASYAKHPNGKGVLTGEAAVRVDATGNYYLFNGTSAATPYAAGVLALLFQQKPQLSVGEIQGLLQQHATQDRLTGKVPNKDWGYGKLDLAAIRRMVEAVKAP